jgi:hypothetical protein
LDEKQKEYMNKLKSICQVLLGLMIIMAGIYGIWFIVKKSLSTLFSINPSLAAVMATAAATIMVSVVSVLISKHFERKAIIELEHRQKKIPIYEKLITLIFQAVFADKLKDQALVQDQIDESMRNITKELVIWGSSSVVKAFSKLRIILATGVQKKPTDIMFPVENVLFAIRKDLGHKDRGVKSGDILVLFATDIEKNF